MLPQLSRDGLEAEQPATVLTDSHACLSKITEARERSGTSLQEVTWARHLEPSYIQMHSEGGAHVARSFRLVLTGRRSAGTPRIKTRPFGRIEVARVRFELTTKGL